MTNRFRALVRAALPLCAAAMLTVPIVWAQSPATCSKVDTVVLQYYPGQIHNLIPWVATQQGFFKKRCLEAKLVSYPSGPAALAASLQGALNFILGSPDNVYIAVSQGFDLRIVAYENSAVNYALVVAKNVPLPHLKEGFPAVMQDLVGKKIGVNTFGSTSDGLSRYDFSVAGLSPDGAKWISYGPLQAGIAGLQNGAFDAIGTFADGMDIAAAATGGTIVADLRDPNVSKAVPGLAAMQGVHVFWAAQAAFVEKNPDLIRRFFEANNEAIDWLKDPQNFDAIIAIVRANAPSPAGIADPEKLLVERTKRYLATQDKHGSLRGLKGWSDWDVAMKRIPTPINVDKLLWETARSVTTP